MVPVDRARKRIRTAPPAWAAAACLIAAGCAGTAPPAAFDPERILAEADATEVARRSEAARVEWMELEIERLRADLASAEQALVDAESGLRGDRSRADAVSSLAEARIQVDRARERAPWQRELLESAAEKLARADAQLAAGHFGASLFFSASAERIAVRTLEHAEDVSKANAMWVRGKRVNLRRGPTTEDVVITVLESGMPVFAERAQDEWVLVRTASGHVGWIHRSLVR